MVNINNKNKNSVLINVSSKNEYNKITPKMDLSLYYTNLSKDWACKLDEKVDGNAYSAKYYAEQTKNKYNNLINNVDINIVADDLSTNKHIKTCSENIEKIKIAYSSSETAKEQAKIATEKAQEAKLTLSNKANINLDNISETGKNFIKSNSGTGMPVGTIFSHSASENFVPENCLPCDGSEYSKVQFNTLYTDWLVSGNLGTCTYEEYQQDVTTNGACAKFGIDITNETFKVPLIPDGYYVRKGQGTSNKAGLPNITGTTGIGESSTCTGAFYLSSWSGSAGKTGTGGSSDCLAGFDASRSNPIYGKSSTVETNAVAYRYFVVVGTNSIKQSEIDWSAWATALQNKVNVECNNLSKLGKETTSRMSMPSNKVINMNWTINSRPAFIAPADGFLEVRGGSDNAFIGIKVFDKQDKQIYGGREYDKEWSERYVILPIQKGYKAVDWCERTLKHITARFIYSEGSI